MASRLGYCLIHMLRLLNLFIGLDSLLTSCVRLLITRNGVGSCILSLGLSGGSQVTHIILLHPNRLMILKQRLWVQRGSLSLRLVLNFYISVNDLCYLLSILYLTHLFTHHLVGLPIDVLYFSSLRAHCWLIAWLALNLGLRLVGLLDWWLVNGFGLLM
jgi:hypothetical protein